MSDDNHKITSQFR